MVMKQLRSLEVQPSNTRQQSIRFIMNNDFVSLVTDEHVPDLRWVAVLSNGETVYQDDDRPGIKPESAWIRLGNYVNNRGLHIVALSFQFRSHVISLPENADGYYFAKGALAFWGGGE